MHTVETKIKQNRIQTDRCERFEKETISDYFSPVTDRPSGTGASKEMFCFWPFFGGEGKIVVNKYFNSPKKSLALEESSVINEG